MLVGGRCSGVEERRIQMVAQLLSTKLPFCVGSHLTKRDLPGMANVDSQLTLQKWSMLITMELFVEVFQTPLAAVPPAPAD